MERTDYGNVVLPVVDNFGNMMNKVIMREDDGDNNTILVPIVAMDCYNPDFKYYYWVTK